MRRYVLRFLLVAIVFTVVNAKADPLGGFSLSFNELQFGEDVLEYYNGGFGGAGSGPGPASGISFTPGLIAVAGDVYGDPDGKAAAPEHGSAGRSAHRDHPVPGDRDHPLGARPV